MPAEYFHVDLDVRPLLHGDKHKECQTKDHKDQVDSWLTYFSYPFMAFFGFLYSIIVVPLMPLINAFDSVYVWAFGPRVEHSEQYDEA
jgi:hypothetical protein